MSIAENLTKHFDEFVAVDGVNLDVPSGQVLVLLGPNGAGKTTTVRMLTSILIPTRGTAKVAGFDVVTQADKVRRSVGVLTEHHGLYGRMNSVDYLEFFASLYGLEGKGIHNHIFQLLDEFGLGDVKNKRLGEYSKGMRQKLALVRALVHNPPVLLLDEPTSAMDPESSRMVRDAILKLRSSDRTVILCTHNLAEAEELADQIAIIRRGKVIFYNTIQKLKENLLGPAEFEVKFAISSNGWTPQEMDGVKLVSRDATSIRWQVNQPEITNPQLVKNMVANGLEIISFQEKKHSLEEAYLEAVNRVSGEEPHV
jgi:ABC-2 type transport system ATP-binding protein